MKVAIIGASMDSLHTIEKAKEMNLQTLVLDANPNAVGLKCADKGLVVDIADEEKTIEVIKKEKVDFLLTVPIGRCLKTIGSVNDAIGLRGISRRSAIICTDKWVFHEELKKRGLRCCVGYQVKGEYNDRRLLYKKIRERVFPLTYPAILKPRYGSGSRDVFVVQNVEELKERFRNTRNEDYILEECIKGVEYGLDGAIIEGRFYLVLLRRKENTPFPRRQCVAYFSVSPSDKIYQIVREFMKKVVEEFSFEECLLHADLIQGENGLFLIEMSLRPSGHNLHNLFTPLCTGIDMVNEYINYQLGNFYSFDVKETKQMMMHYFDFIGKVEYIPSKEYIENTLGISFVKWVCNFNEGDVLMPVTDGKSLIGRGYFILENERKDILIKWAEEVKQLFRLQKEWD